MKKFYKTTFLNFKSQDGFIALISSVIISAILLTLLFSTNTSTFYTRFDALDLENKRVASGLAEACVDQALLKIANDYSYDPTNEVVSVGSNTCTIQSITPHAPRSGNSTLVTIDTSASYNKTWSNFESKATVWNPSSASFTPPPSCYLWVNTNSIYAGQSVTLGWNSSNATSFKIIAQANHTYDINSASVPSGSQSFTPSASETWVGTVTNASGTSQCTTPSGYISPSVIIQPPPTCADTVMVLDRTGSMASSDLSSEGTAAKTLITLYQNATPQGQVGVGSFGAYPNASLPLGSASIPTAGQLSFNFSGLTSITNSITSSNSSVGSNLADAMTVGANELSSVRHDSSKAKVLILVSDGVPNEPSGSTISDTGFNSPTSNAQNANGELWSNPTSAYTTGAGDASDPVSEDDRHRFFNFNFPTLPTGASIKGIEADADAWATTTSTAAGPTVSISKSPTFSFAPNQWTNPNSAFISDNVYSTDSTNGHQQGYGNFGFSIPTNATIQGIQVVTEAKVSSSSSITTPTLYPNGQGNYTSWTNGESAIDETGTPDCSSGDSIIEATTNDRESVILDLSSIPTNSIITNVTITAYDRGDSVSGGTYKTFARLNNVDTDATSTLSASGTSSCNTKTQFVDLPDTTKNNSTNLEIGVVKVSGNSNAVRVGAIRAVVTYIPATSGSINIALSSNDGIIYTSSKATSLNTIESTASPSGNSTSDLWGRTWLPSDLNNGNFSLKIQNNSTTGIIVSLDQVLVNVYYSLPTPAPVACQLGMDLSYNNGSNFTAEKADTLSSALTTYTFGSSADIWGRTWGTTDFSNPKFIARVHAIDPGSGCDNNSVDHLDWLRMKVYYSVPTDPSNAATISANNAKASGVEIFTVHFGDTSGRNFLASLASGGASNDVGTSNTQASRDQENGDGDNFYISPSSSDMTTIFHDIGAKVCPASVAPPIPPPPPSPPAPPAPPPNITINSWVEQ